MVHSKVALITGASSGIGQATARLLAQNGYTVFGTSRNQDQPAGEGFTLLPLDVCSDESVQTCVQTVMAQAGRIDLLINNAGFSQGGAIEENTVADAQALFDTNFFGVMRVTNAVLPIMRQQGRGQIINISSVVGITALPYAGIYSATKFALEGLTEALRSEVAQFNIKVSLVEPGPIKTNIAGRPPAQPVMSYIPARQSVLGSLQQSIKNGPDPIVVARVIVQIAESPDPRLRNPVGGRIKLFTTMKRLLPEAAFEGLRRRIFNVPSRSADAKQLQTASR